MARISNTKFQPRRVWDRPSGVEGQTIPQQQDRSGQHPMDGFQVSGRHGG